MLNLAGCGLKNFPLKILECIWLEKLILNDLEYSHIDNINIFPEIPNNFSVLENLIELKLDRLPIVDISFLSSMAWLTALSLRDVKLQDFSILSNLTNLEYLDLYLTSIEDISFVKKLIKLKSIDLTGAKLSDFSSLTDLGDIEYLDCSSTNLVSLFFLSKLVKLKHLRVSHTKIESLEGIEHCVAMETLNISYTKINDIKILSCLPNIKILYANDCKITDLNPVKELEQLNDISMNNSSISDITPLYNLKNLTTLNIGYTSVSDLSAVSKLFNLTELRVGKTLIKDISPLASLEKLAIIDCSETEITNIEVFKNLRNIEAVNLSGTNVQSLLTFSDRIISKGLGINSSQRYISQYFIEDDIITPNDIYIENCKSLIIPPVELFEGEDGGREAVPEYFSEIRNNSKKLNEVKIIILGESSAGKTSLVRHLENENFDEAEGQTHGIRIRRLNFEMSDGDEVMTNVWDFGGQEIMHATHQFFLSRRSIYVLVLSSRNEERVEKWLKHAASYGGRSPVLVVLNKIDENPAFQVNQKQLVSKYPQIKGFHRISCKTGDGVVAFREALRQEIDQSDTRITPFPVKWLAVKQHFAGMEADYIDTAQFEQVCLANGIERQVTQEVLLQFLHDLGLVINFRNLRNFDTQILNPLWLTNGVYRIINSYIVAASGGVLREADFDRVVNDPRYSPENTAGRVFHYPRNKLHYIVRVMQEFELCYQLDPATYVVPQLLPVQEPDYKHEGATIRFIVEFPEYMPDSIFPRLMVRLHGFIYNNLHWRTGMILQKAVFINAVARVRWDREDQKIMIDVSGEERRRLLSYVRETLKEITRDFTNLPFNELVPVPGTSEPIPYLHLVKAEEKGKKEIFIGQIGEDVLVKDMLDGVEETDMRNKSRQYPIKAFVSYAQEDSDQLKVLHAALSPLKTVEKLELWDDQHVLPGDQTEDRVKAEIIRSDIILCLMSNDFINSGFLKSALFKELVEKKIKYIIPIRLRMTDWEGLEISSYPPIPDSWISSAENKDETWAQVSKSLRKIIKEINERRLEGDLPLASL